VRLNERRESLYKLRLWICEELLAVMHISTTLLQAIKKASRISLSTTKSKEAYMQLHEPHNIIYKTTKAACTEQSQNITISSNNETTEIIAKRTKLVRLWDNLKAKSISDAEIANITSLSRASYYRFKRSLVRYGSLGLLPKSRRPNNVRQSSVSKGIITLVYNLRVVNPTYGKAKIAVILRRDYDIKISESTVGRILKKLMDSHKIKRSISALRVRRRRRFNSHAKSWSYDMKPKAPGEMVQIDHMTVVKHGVSMKHFQAWDPITKVIVADVTSNATSMAAAKFLRKMLDYMPFTVKSVQVDGGSEFMKHFEEECQKLNIELYVLPPKRPQYNGGVERGNRIFREEFYAKKIYASSIEAFRHHLSKAVHKYNDYRPHSSLKGLTPFEYTNKILAA